jgi:hypothetical protein
MADSFTERAFAAKLSRRACLPLIAAVALSPALAVRAQGGWQIYRREDLGLEIEFPTTPKIEAEESNDKDDLELRSVDASVDFEGSLFGAAYHEYRQPVSITEEIAAQRISARHMGLSIVSETALTMNGFPGVEFVTHRGKNGFAILRVVIAQNRRYLVSVFGSQSDKDSSTVRRFFDSFRLLSNSR